MTNNIVEFLEYTKNNYFYSLLTIFTYWFGFLLLSLAVIIASFKAMVKEWFSWKALYSKEIENKKE